MTNRLFLTAAEIKELTGASTRRKQIECLNRNRIPHTLDVRGKPVVTVSAIEGKTMRQSPVEAKPSWTPAPLRAA